MIAEVIDSGYSRPHVTELCLRGAVGKQISIQLHPIWKAPQVQFPTKTRLGSSYEEATGS